MDWKTLFAALAMVGAACPSHAQEELRIGMLTTLSGPAGAVGNEVRDGFMLGVEMAGGKLGGVPTKVIVLDDEQKPDVARKHVERLIKRDKVQVVTGTIFSNVLMAIHKTVVDSKTLLLSPNSGPTTLSGAGCNQFFFTYGFENTQANLVIGEYLKRRGIERIVTIVPNYQGGKDGVAGLKLTYDGEIVKELYTGLGQLDYTTELTEIRALKPDALFAFMPGGWGISLLKQYNESGLSKEVPFYSTYTVDELSVPVLGDMALGASTAVTWNEDFDNAANRKFSAAYRAKYGRPPTLGAVQAFDVAQGIDAAVKARQGKLNNKEALIAELRKANFASPRGPFQFNINQFPIQDWYIAQVVKGPDGKPVLKTKDKVYTQLKDPYANYCKM